MDPTQDLAETRKLMTLVQRAIDEIVDEFSRRRQSSSEVNSPAASPPRRTA